MASPRPVYLHDFMSAPTPTGPKELRFERWILTIAEHLKALGVQCAPHYEGCRGSDILLLDIATGPGAGQLRVHRMGKGALLLLLAESRALARLLHTNFERLTGKAGWFARPERDFMRCLAHIASEIDARFEDARTKFPVAALDPVQRRYPGTLPMVGLEGRYRLEASDDPLNARGGAALRFGAKIPRTRGWDPSSAPTQRHRLALLVGGAFLVDGQPVVPSQEENGPAADDVGDAILETVFDFPLDVMSTTYDLTDATSCVPDVGDCGGFDIPDLSCIDVGGCVPCDCGF